MVAQVALSLVLLIAAGLVVRSLQNAQTLDFGFDPERALAMSLDLNLQGYDVATGEQFQKRLLERVRAVPGVRAAALTDLVPLDLHYPNADVYVEGTAPARGADVPRTLYSVVGPGYFETIGTKLVAGREFTEQDNRDGQRVVVVNQTFARRFFHGLSSVGEVIGKRYSNRGLDGPFHQIVGVAQDGKYRTVAEPERPFVWFSMLQRPQGLVKLLARTEGDPQGVIGAIRGEIRNLDSSLPVSGVKTLTEHLGFSLLPARIAAWLIGGFGLLALALSVIGIYGVTAYSVTQRTREIGIRMALGAKPADIMKLVITQGVKLTLLGVMTGLAAAFVLTRLINSLLLGVSATDPLTFLLVVGLLAGVALMACYIPARRATRVEPMVALRYE
jgi:predicted permease